MHVIHMNINMHAPPYKHFREDAAVELKIDEVNSMLLTSMSRTTERISMSLAIYIINNLERKIQTS